MVYEGGICSIERDTNGLLDEKNVSVWKKSQ